MKGYLESETIFRSIAKYFALEELRSRYYLYRVCLVYVSHYLETLNLKKDDAGWVGGSKILVDVLQSPPIHAAGKLLRCSRELDRPCGDEYEHLRVELAIFAFVV